MISTLLQLVTNVLPATEELHAKQCKHHDEEEEEEDEGDDGLHGVHQRHHQVP